MGVNAVSATGEDLDKVTGNAKQSKTSVSLDFSMLKVI